MLTEKWPVSFYELDSQYLIHGANYAWIKSLAVQSSNWITAEAGKENITSTHKDIVRLEAGACCNDSLPWSCDKAVFAQMFCWVDKILPPQQTTDA